MTTTMKVRAVEGRKLPAVDGDGAPILGRFVGYSRRGEIVPEGVDVPDDAHHRRAVKAGDLELIAEAR